MECRLSRRRLEWLGHVARIEDERIPKALLFGSFPNKRPAHGPRKRWRDCVRSDVKPLDDWYEVATSSRSKWRKAYRCLADKQNRPRPSPVVCQTCHRSFSHVSDRKRHKCTATRALPVSQQPGSRHCDQCDRWFRSKGGFARHNCSPATSSAEASSDILESPVTNNMSCERCSFHCARCNCCVLSRQGMKRHKCSRGSARATNTDRSSFCIVCNCGRRFSRPQDLSRHRPYCSEPAPPPPWGPHSQNMAARPRSKVCVCVCVCCKLQCYSMKIDCADQVSDMCCAVQPQTCEHWDLQWCRAPTRLAFWISMSSTVQLESDHNVIRVHAGVFDLPLHCIVTDTIGFSPPTRFACADLDSNFRGPVHFICTPAGTIAVTVLKLKALNNNLSKTSQLFFHAQARNVM